MPKRCGCEVNVTDTRHETFIEYGLQQDSRYKKKLSVSTFIEAKNGIQFLIQVKVDNPFNFDQDLDSIGSLGVACVNQPLPAQQVRSEHNTRTKHFDDNRPAEEELGGLLIEPSAASAAPFDLMVSVFIDGRAKPECRQMIYLDHKHPRYNACCVLKGRWVDAGDASSRDSKAGLLQWYFTDRGIDHILERLDVKKVLKKADTDAREAEFKTVRENVEEGLFEDVQDKIMKTGEIEVRIRRVVVLNSDAVEQRFRPYHYAGRDEKPRDLDDDCTHTTSFAPKTGSAGQGKMQTFPLRHVAWAYYKKGEDFWAKFVFHYTARHKLVNMGLSEQDGTLTLRGRTQAPEPDPSSKRGKKRASSVDGESLEQSWAENPVPRKTVKSVSRLKDFDRESGAESDGSEEEREDALREQERSEIRLMHARIDNYEKAKIENDNDQIS